MSVWRLHSVWGQRLWRLRRQSLQRRGLQRGSVLCRPQGSRFSRTAVLYQGVLHLGGLRDRQRGLLPDRQRRVPVYPRAGRGAERGGSKARRYLLRRWCRVPLGPVRWKPLLRRVLWSAGLSQQRARVHPAPSPGCQPASVRVRPAIWDLHHGRAVLGGNSCATGACVVSNPNYCTQTCCRTDNCPQGLKCVYDTDDTVGYRVCESTGIPGGPLPIGSPCSQNTECKTAQCVQVGQLAPFCTDACCSDSDCGDTTAFACRPLFDAKGTALLLCVPR